MKAYVFKTPQITSKICAEIAQRHKKRPGKFRAFFLLNKSKLLYFFLFACTFLYA